MPVNPVGSEFLVNTFTTGNQRTYAESTQSLAMDADGDFVVTWSSYGQEGSSNGYGVYGQRYNAAGTAQGSEFRINTTTANNQRLSTVAMDADGDFVVTWSSYTQDGSGYGVYGQRYNAAGTAQGSEFRINTTTASFQVYSTVAMDADGDFVVTWSSYGQEGSSNGYGVYGQRYNAAGTAQGSEFRINTTTANQQRFSTVAMDANGDFVVTWTSSGQDGSDYGVYGQRYNAAGTAQGSEFRINTTTANQQRYSTVAMDADGDFVVTWTSSEQDGSGYGVYGQRYNAAGTAQGSEFRINTTTANSQRFSTVAMDADGDFAVTWSSYAQDGSSYGVYGQRYNAAGTAQGSEFRINTTTANSQRFSTVAMDADGDFAVTWSSYAQDGSGYGVYAQRYANAVANNAPTLTDISLTLTAVNEDAGDPVNGTAVGTLVSSLVSIGGNVTDTDPSAVTGIAVTAADTSNGSWHYSTDNGTTWNLLGAVSNTSARLLAADAITRLYFQPNANYNGAIANAITFQAWDTTAGTNGGTADPSTNGGTTAFSTATDTAAIAVTPINDAPVLMGTATLTTINEDVLDAANTGTKVSALINGLTTDVDDDPKAIAITGVDNTKGVWQYSTDGGTIWTAFSATTSDSTATVLGATSFYQANLGTAPNAQGQLSFTNLNPVPLAPVGTQTLDSSGTILNTDVDSNIYAGYSNFSGADPVNPPLPKLDNVEGYSVSFNLQLLTESHTNPNRAGFSIIVVSNDKTKAIELGFQDGNIFAQTDAGFTAGESKAFNTKQSVDYRLEVLGNSYNLFANSTSILTGDLRDYSTFNGAPDPYETPNFIFLGDDSTSAKGSFNLSQVVVQTDNRVRFVPNANENGDSTINFRAWDTTDGKSAGAIVNASVNGGITSFSSDSATATITVTPINDIPTVTTAIVDQSATESTVFNFAVPANTFTDVDAGDTLTYTATQADDTSLPSWLTFNATNQTFSGTPTNTDIGSLDIKVTVKDTADATAEDTFSLTVANFNEAPTVANAIADRLATEDTLFTFAVPANTFTDDDAGDILTYTATQADNTPLPSWLTFNATNQTFSGTPLNAQVGSLNVKVKATDTGLLTAEDTFTISTANTNDAPTVTNAIADQTATEDAPFTFTVPTNTFTDVDAGAILTYTATLANSSPLPTWLTFNPTTRAFSGTPRNANVDNLDIKVKATDGAGTTAEDVFMVKVANLNQPPAIGTPITPIPQPVTATQAFTLKIPVGAFTDPDAGDTLTFSASLENGAPLPPWLALDAKTGLFSGVPDIFSVGNLSLKVNATDAQGSKTSQLLKFAIANPTGITGTPTSLIDFSGGKKGITLKAKKGQLLRGTSRSDILKGTQGSDRINSGGRRDSRSKDKLYGFNGNDRLKAGGGNDYAEGGRGNDFLQGNKGRDLLQGSNGIDRLLGGKGDDLLIGGNGADTLIGGSGRDMFVFANVNEGKDAIADFTLSEDVIDLRSLFSQPQFAGATSYVRYLKYVQLTQVGASTEVKVDADGNGVGNTFTTLATLNNIGIGAVGSRNFVIS